MNNDLAQSSTGPIDANEELIFAVEGFRVDVQMRIWRTVRD